MGSSASGIAPKLYQRARDALASDIAGGALPAGMRLTESGVAGRFGISRAPARQALAELQRLGLVRKAGARGYEVVAGDLGCERVAGALVELGSDPGCNASHFVDRSRLRPVFTKPERSACGSLACAPAKRPSCTTGIAWVQTLV